MSDYIKREDVMKLFKPEEWGTPDERWRPESEFGLLIDAIPSADVTENVRLSPITTITDNKPTEWGEVVRCKECKHCNVRQNIEHPQAKTIPYCEFWCGFVTEGDYCSYGERKDGEEK